MASVGKCEGTADSSPAPEPRFAAADVGASVVIRVGAGEGASDWSSDLHERYSYRIGLYPVLQTHWLVLVWATSSVIVMQYVDAVSQLCAPSSQKVM